MDWFIYFLLFTVLHIPGIINFYHKDGANNPYLLFAHSLLNGELRLPAMPNYLRISLGTPEEMLEFWRVWDLLGSHPMSM